MYVLNDYELRDLCRSVITAVSAYDQISVDWFSVIEASGCRPNELHLPNLWADAGTELILQPLKGNNLRHLPYSLFPAQFIDDVRTNNQWWVNYSVDRFMYIFKTYAAIQPVFCGNKEISLNCYRHNKVRQMTLQGYSPEQIVEFFGWTNDAMFSTYQYGDIYYN